MHAWPCERGKTWRRWTKMNVNWRWKNISEKRKIGRGRLEAKVDSKTNGYSTERTRSWKWMTEPVGKWVWGSERQANVPSMPTSQRHRQKSPKERNRGDSDGCALLHNLVIIIILIEIFFKLFFLWSSILQVQSLVYSALAHLGTVILMTVIIAVPLKSGFNAAA